MEREGMQRQAATPKGLQKRIRDLSFEKVTDPRLHAGKVVHELPSVLSLVVAGIATGAGSLRQVETRSRQILAKSGPWMGLRQPIADNTVGDILRSLDVEEMVACLPRMVKAEQRRGNLKPSRLPRGTVAIDGKNVATLSWTDLCRIMNCDPHTTNAEYLRSLYEEQYPEVQVCVRASGDAYGLVRVHTATLVSSDAAFCIYQRWIPGQTNEIGALPGMLAELDWVYRKTGLVEMFTTDAGNTSLATATLTKETYHRDYFAQIKSEHGRLYQLAVDELGSQPAGSASQTLEDRQKGSKVTYRLWRRELPEDGCLDWRHARQLLRVQREVVDPDTGDRAVGNRYYVTSRTPDGLSPASCLKISRGHWRCENETHWTADAVLDEDLKRLTGSRHPIGVLVVSILRRIGAAILAVARRMSRFGHTKATPTWKQVSDHFFLTLCASVLETERFDAVTD